MYRSVRGGTGLGISNRWRALLYHQACGALELGAADGVDRGVDESAGADSVQCVGGLCAGVADHRHGGPGE